MTPGGARNHPSLKRSFLFALQGFRIAVMTERNIKLMLGIKSDGSIEKIYTLEHSETSGIGSRVVDNKSGYSDNYIGKTEDSYSEVDAISGATISSKAYKKAISIAYEGFDIVKEAA